MLLPSSQTSEMIPLKDSEPGCFICWRQSQRVKDGSSPIKATFTQVDITTCCQSEGELARHVKFNLPLTGVSMLTSAENEAM